MLLWNQGGACLKPCVSLRLNQKVRCIWLSLKASCLLGQRCIYLCLASKSNVELTHEPAAAGSLRPEASECEWDFDCDWEELEQLQLKLSRYASGSDSAQLGSSASPLAAATMLHGEAHSPEWTTSDISTTSIFDDLFFEPLSGPSSPPSADYHDFVQGFVLSPVSDSLVTAQQPIEQQQHPSPPNMAPAAPPASDVHQKMDEVNIGDLFMEADTLGADTPGHAGLPHLPQQVPTAASLPVLDQTGSTQLDIRRHSPSPDPIHQTHTRESPPPQAGVSIISPALSQTIGMGRPTRKRRSEDVSMVSQPTTGPTLTPSGTETARLRPAKRRKATSTDANQKKVPAVTPARKRAAKRAARPASPFPELSQVEIAQAKADGMVWAKIGSYDAWPAQVGATIPALVYTYQHCLCILQHDRKCVSITGFADMSASKQCFAWADA